MVAQELCKEDKSLEDEEGSGRPSECDNDQLRASLKLVILQQHEKLPKNSPLIIQQSFGTWSKAER